MTDVKNVVACLKLTKKGKLPYRTNWNPVELHNETAQTNLRISPFSIKHVSRLAREGLCEREDEKSEAYKVYFSPKRAATINQHTSPKNSLRTKLMKPASSTIPSYGIQHSTRNNSQFVYASNTDLHLHDVEQEYKHTLKSLSNMRVQDMKARLTEMDLEYEKALQVVDKNVHRKMSRETGQLLAEENTITENACEELACYQEIKRQRDQVASEKLKQTEIHSKDLEIRIKLKEEQKRINLEKMKTLAQFAEPARKVMTRITQLYQNCKSKNTIPRDFAILVSQVSKEYTECSEIINEGVNNNNSSLNTNIQQAATKIKTLEHLLKACEDFAGNLEENRLAEEKKKKEEEEKAKQALSSAPATTVVAIVTIPSAATPVTTETMLTTATTSSSISASINVITPTSNQISAPFNDVSITDAMPSLLPIEPMLRQQLHLFSAKPAFAEYLRLQKILVDTGKRYESFNKSTVKEKKAHKFDLYKVVNTTINAISDESPKHLLDKVIKLNALLTEQGVEMCGKTISTKQDQHALLLCKDLLAKKLVLQGTSQIASSFKTAFPIAAVALSVWSLSPDVGELLLAHFFANCPYLVPFYIPKDKDMSTLDYCRLVGYEVDGQDVEAEDIYLKKLSGIVRLYAAIIQTEIPPQFGNRNHPHSLEHGWIWFTRLLNLEPRPSVTATIIYDFLEVAGYALMKRFGKQFQKLLLILCREYLPKILQITPNGSKAGAMRLKMFLTGCIKEGRIKEPEGRLSKQWWRSGR